jgi:hypothetical protein
VTRQRSTSVRLEITARRAGWYTFQALIRYRDRGVERTMAALAPTTIYIADAAPHDWYYRTVAAEEGGPLTLLSSSASRRLVSELEQRTPYGFPPSLAAPAARSGRRP